MSYNIRRYGDEDFPEHHWDQRKTYVRDLICKHLPDILCTQEDHPVQLDFILEKLPHYARYGFYNEDMNGSVHGEENAIIFNTKKFTLLEKGHFWLTDTPQVPSKLPSQSRHFRTATYIKLQTTDGQKIFVCNTHFDHFSQDVQKEEAKILANYLETIKKNNHYIMCGDLNVNEDASPHIAQLATCFVRIHPKTDQETTYQSWIEMGGERCTDFIFSDLSVHSTLIDRSGYKMTNETMTFASDHFPIVAVLTTK
ncbi:endonuclease/exonuclease/phosphatase family protein [Candidatus Peregrinibacteria bacterium]|nr:endonuclease/exonuclease/phosphatase family protein [Candidatus Peregrinibacteria bacterium]